MNDMEKPIGGDLVLPKAEVKIYGLVRDRNGKPRIDGDPADLHPSIKAAMTDAEFNQACEEWKANGKA